MYIQFSHYDGSNPYVTKNNAELFRMIKDFQLDQVENNSFKIIDKAQYWTAHPGRKLTAYEKGRAALRDFAQIWQGAFHMFNYSWGDLCGWYGFFEEYGKKYGLLREFRENGVI